MKFGKLSDISQVDFTLPPLSELSYAYLSKSSPVANPAIYAGPTGWSMKEWLGIVYPKKTPAKSFLSYFSRQFNTIEFNTTHYRIPTIETVEKWYAESAADFKFCPKIPQSISHSRDLGLNNPALTLFQENIRLLQEKIGSCFIQLPPYFDAARLPLLDAFLQKWPTDLPLSVEVRHESWFTNEKILEKYFKTLEKNGISAVITDVAGRRDVLHQFITHPIVMIRFVGNGLHPTDYERADEWVSTLKNWTQQGVREVYFFPHQPDNILSPQMTDYFIRKVKKEIPNAITRGPELLADDQGEQLSLF